MFANVFGRMFRDKAGEQVPLERSTLVKAVEEAKQDYLFRTVNDYTECPWPANASRKERCEQCVAGGGQFTVWYHGQRTLFDTRICVEHHGGREKRQHIATLIDETGLTSVERGLTFARADIDQHNRAAMEALQAWQPGGQGIYLGPILSGPKFCAENPKSNGTGKSHILACMALRLCQMEIGAKILRACEFEREIRQAQAERANLGSVLAPYKFAEALLWDDLGAESTSTSSDFVVVRVYELLDYRSQGQFPTFFTSNLMPVDLESRFGETYGPKIASRVGGLIARRIGVGGPDRRLKGRR